MSKLLGQIYTAERKSYFIKDLGRVVTGKTPSKNNPEDWGNGIDFITPTDIKTEDKFYINSNRKLSEKGEGRFKNMILPPNSVLVTCIGTVGKVIMNKERALSNQQINSIVIENEKFDNDYIFYKILSLVPLIKSSAIGSTMPIINKSSFEEIEFDAPDLPIQKKVAEILSAYDEKIENNNLIIKKLEATAQTLFNEWFVNFRFPGHEKTKFVDSEMGEIPEGWEVRHLDQIADFLNGVASQKYPAINKTDSLPVIKIREMNSGIDQNSDRATREIDKKYIIKNGDILFAWSGSLTLMIWVGGEGVLNQHIFKVTSEDFPRWFVYQWVARHLQNFKIIAEGKATTMGHIQRHHLSESLVVVPTESILSKASEIMSDFFEQQILLQEENISLKSQRDKLLAKLI